MQAALLAGGGCELVGGIDERHVYEGAAGGGGCGAATCLAPPAGAVLWLRADAGLTADANQLSWQDQITEQLAVASAEDSGGDSVPTVDASSSRFNGHAVVHFDGAGDRIRLPPLDATFEGGFTAAFALRAVVAHLWDGFLFLAETGNTNAIAIGRELTWDRLRLTIQGTYDPVAYWSGILQSSGGIATGGLSPQIIVVVQRPDDATVWFYENGKGVATNWGDVSLPTAALRDASFLGWVPDYSFEGDIAEAVVYDRALDDVERSALESYLAAKYAVALSPPCQADCVEVLARGQGLATDVVASGDRVAWTNLEGGQVMVIDDATSKVPSSPRALHGLVSESIHPAHPYIDADHVYWGDELRLHRVKVGGGPDESLSVTGEVSDIAMDADRVWLSSSSAKWIASVSRSDWDTISVTPMIEKVTSVSVDETHVYWVQATEGEVADGTFRLPKGAIDPGLKELVSAGWAVDMALDASNVVLVSSGSISRIDKAAVGSGSTLVTEYGVGHIALDGGYVYYTNSSTGAVRRVPLAGGEPKTIASGQSEPAGIAVVGDWVVWANHDGTIVRAPKPS